MLAAEPVTRLGSVVAALLPLLALPSSSYATVLDDGLGAASELSEGGQPAAAASLLEGLTEACPDLYLALGFHHHRAGNHRRAVTHYRRATRLWYGNPLALTDLGWALLGLGDRGGATRAFEAVLEATVLSKRVRKHRRDLSGWAAPSEPQTAHSFEEDNIDTQRLKELAFSDTGFIFDPLTGTTFSANGTALLILTLLKEGWEHAQLLAELALRYEVSGVDIGRDYDDLVTTLRESGLATGAA